MFDKVKDSGEREEFNTGSRRDTQKGKGRYDLIPAYPIYRLARHYENGAVKYGDRNWEKGQPISRYISSMRRHTFKATQLDEDHLSAIAWNAFAIIETKRLIDEGKLPKELDDVEWL